MRRKDLGLFPLLDVGIDLFRDEALDGAPQLLVFRGRLHGNLLK
jgi:hypothetical protein